MNADGVLVEARRKAKRAPQVPPERVNPKHRIAWCQPVPEQPRTTRHRGGEADQREPELVRGLGRHSPEHDGEDQLVHGVPHSSSAPAHPAAGPRWPLAANVKRR